MPPTSNNNNNNKSSYNNGPMHNWLIRRLNRDKGKPADLQTQADTGRHTHTSTDTHTHTLARGHTYWRQSIMPNDVARLLVELEYCSSLTCLLGVMWQDTPECCTLFGCNYQCHLQFKCSLDIRWMFNCGAEGETEGERHREGDTNVCSTITLRFLHNQRRHRHNNQPKWSIKLQL